MAHMSERCCQWCKTKFMARTADVNRGWGRFCSKSCKAMRQEKKTGQYRALQSERFEGRSEKLSKFEQQEIDHQNALYESTSCHGQDAGEGF